LGCENMEKLKQVSKRNNFRIKQRVIIYLDIYSHGAKYCNFPMRYKSIFITTNKGVTRRYFDESTYYNVLC
jgi:hypothetical protein